MTSNPAPATRFSVYRVPTYSGAQHPKANAVWYNPLENQARLGYCLYRHQFGPKPMIGMAFLLDHCR